MSLCDWSATGQETVLPEENTISFERGPRSERGPGSARARQGLQLEASMRARADPGPHSPRGPLSREILLETRLFVSFFLDQRNSPASHHEKTSLPDGSTCSYVPTSCGCNATKPIRPEHGGSPWVGAFFSKGGVEKCTRPNLYGVLSRAAPWMGCWKRPQWDLPDGQCSWRVPCFWTIILYFLAPGCVSLVLICQSPMDKLLPFSKLFSLPFCATVANILWQGAVWFILWDMRSCWWWVWEHVWRNPSV